MFTITKINQNAGAPIRFLPISLFLVLSSASCLFSESSEIEHQGTNNGAQNNGSNNGSNNGTTANNGIKPFCGDGTMNQQSELCDGKSFSLIETCETYNGMGSTGELLCSPSCIVDPMNCTVGDPQCGNGVIEGDEECDPAANEAALSCGENYHGSVSCDEDCRNDRTQCVPIYQEISAGGRHTCALRPDGSVRCWGNNTHEQLMPPEDVVFRSISAGVWHTCGIDQINEVHCWGGSSAGGQTSAPLGEFAQISAGLEFTCGVTLGGLIFCWGDELDGGPPYNEIAGAESISSSRSHACATFGNSAQCWGNGPGHVPFAKPDQISAGDQYTCLLNNGSAQCWGRTENDPQFEASSEFPMSEFTFIDAGRYHACGILTNGIVDCWGRDALLETSPALPMTQLSVGGLHTCALDEKGQAYCWGTPNSDQDLGQMDVPTD